MKHALPENVHATCVAIGCHGLLIRGASGSGKSALALALLSGARTVFSALISDDRTVLRAVNGRLVASAPETIQGLVEVRGAGPITIPRTSPGAVISTVIDLLPAEDVLRVPETGEDAVMISAISLPRLTLAAGPEHVGTNAVAVRTLLSRPKPAIGLSAASISR